MNKHEHKFHEKVFISSPTSERNRFFSPDLNWQTFCQSPFFWTALIAPIVQIHISQLEEKNINMQNSSLFWYNNVDEFDVEFNKNFELHFQHQLLNWILHQLRYGILSKCQCWHGNSIFVSYSILNLTTTLCWKSDVFWMLIKESIFISTVFWGLIRITKIFLKFTLLYEHFIQCFHRKCEKRFL